MFIGLSRALFSRQIEAAFFFGTLKQRLGKRKRNEIDWLMKDGR
jgi:hypothetical protein